MNGNRVEAGNVADLLSRNWWLLAVRGIIAIVFGILAFIWPGLSLLGLVYLFGIYALLNGALAFVAASNAPKGWPRFGSLIFSGVLSIAAGVIAFVWPGITALALLVIIAVWAIIGGAMEISAAIRLRAVLAHEWMWIVAGIASIVFGLALLVWPGAGILALLWLVGTWAIVFGALLVGLAFRLRRHGETGLGAAAPAAA